MPTKSVPHDGKGRSSTSSVAYPWAALDTTIIVTYAVFFTIGVFVDYINAFAPVGGLTRKTAADWSWPPSFMWPPYFFWCEHADPVLQLNPLWIKYLSLLSPVLFCPFYAVSIYAIRTTPRLDPHPQRHVRQRAVRRPERLLCGGSLG